PWPDRIRALCGDVLSHRNTVDARGNGAVPSPVGTLRAGARRVGMSALRGGVFSAEAHGSALRDIGAPPKRRSRIFRAPPQNTNACPGSPLPFRGTQNAAVEVSGPERRRIWPVSLGRRGWDPLRSA